MKKVVWMLVVAAMVACQTTEKKDEKAGDDAAVATEQVSGKDAALVRRVATDAEKASFDSVVYTVDRIQCNEMHSMMVAHNDTIIYEYYAPGFDANRLHILWSATKTFTATAVGFAVQDGLVDLDTPIVNYIPREELPEQVAKEFELLTLDQLLKMSSGLPVTDFTDRIRGREDVNALHEAATAEFVCEPGTKWRYNNMDTYLAGYVVTKVTGKPLDEYLNEKLFSKIGIREWVWEKDPQGICTGAWGLHVSAESLMRMGLFMMHKGTWQGERLLNEDWFDTACTARIMQDVEATSFHDWNSGYGYQVWICKQPNTYRIDGMWGQFAVIMPDKNTVCVMNTLCNKTSVQLDAVWKWVYGFWF